MIFNIDLPDGSDELLMLQGIVSEINAVTTKEASALGRPAPTPMTELDYMTNLVMNPLRKRVKKHLQNKMMQLDTQTLKDKLK